MTATRLALVAASVLSLGACGDMAKLSVDAGTGPHPALPPQQHDWFPEVNVASASEWKAGAHPLGTAGTVVNAFASGLDHPRWLYVLPNGDVLVAESDAPPKPDDAKGLGGWVHKMVMRYAGSGRHHSANRITLLRDTTGKGVVDVRTVLVANLNSPIGMVLVGDQLYVAETDAVLRFPLHPGETEIRAPGVKVCELPGGRVNHHWTKTLIASADGTHLYAGVGSNSNVAENGLEAENERAAVWEIDPATGAHRIFASGLRNPVGLAWEPHTHQLWVAVNERDELGSDLVPDYMTGLRQGAFYGWPFSYFGQNLDWRAKPMDLAKVATAIPPDYALGAHTASLGLAWAGGSRLPGLGDGMFVGQHGSWNRAPRSGYKVIFVPFTAGMPSGPPRDVLNGFLDDSGHAQGRPAGVALTPRGDLLVADDVGNTVWRVSPANADASPPAR